MSRNRSCAPALVLLSSIILWHPSHTFTITSSLPWHAATLQAPHGAVTALQSQPAQMEVDYDNDESLLKAVKRRQLEDLCDELKLSKEGEKGELLQRLREHAQQKAQADRERNLRRRESVERGMEEGDAKARHTVLSDADDRSEEEDEEEEEEGFFYFSLPAAKEGADKQRPAGKDGAGSSGGASKVSVAASDIRKTESFVRAAPKLAQAEPNSAGERAVAVYASTDQNDLTGVAAAQTSATGNFGASMAASGAYSPAGADRPEATLAGGPFGDQSGALKRKASEEELDRAVGRITELVQHLLAMTGAPGFQDDVVPMEMEGAPLADAASAAAGPLQANNVFASAASFGFVGFDASRVPASMLTDNSSLLRVANGEALTKVLTDFEMRSIGLDGKFGDDRLKGGGHYLEVRKVATFLEGFRNAEVRRVARETATMLLDKLVADGVKGLDQMLATMTRGSDDSSDAGELNDSLVLYLEDAIRQQEKKVGKKIGIQGIKNSWTDMRTDPEDLALDTKDGVSNMWNVTTDEDGKIIESLDPNDPRVKQTLEQELKSSTETKFNNSPSPSLEPAEQLLILLTLLKERVKAEALFPNDERGRNLRLLAYCLHAGSEKNRETILMEHFGSSISRVDSFLDLLTSSIDYAESTSHQLQPSKSAPLDIRLLNSIKATVEDIKDNQAWKASGFSAVDKSTF